jgi:hypothetical protein
MLVGKGKTSCISREVPAVFVVSDDVPRERYKFFYRHSIFAYLISVFLHQISIFLKEVCQFL